MVRRVLVLAVFLTVLACSPAMAQAPVTGSVTHVVDGDTVDAQLPDGRVVRVRLIGIDTPERGECGFDEASAHMESIALGRTVALIADPIQDTIDRYGRSLYYLDRDDGLDLGLQMIRAGWAAVFVYETNFQRVGDYVAAETAAGGGVWRRCDGDFHLTVAEEQRASAEDFIDRYYTRVSNRQFRAAWGMLGRSVRRDFGSFKTWKVGHRRSLGVSVVELGSQLSRGRAVVSVRLRSRDRDACSGRVVGQRFRGGWVLAPRRGSWVAARARVRKTGGGDVRLSKSECAPRRPPGRPPTPPPPRVDCQGYSPCLPPGPDVDCAGGGGNGPVRERPGVRQRLRPVWPGREQRRGWLRVAQSVPESHGHSRYFSAGGDGAAARRAQAASLSRMQPARRRGLV